MTNTVKRTHRSWRSWWQSSRTREAVAAYVFLSPLLVGLFGLILGAILFALYISFTDWNIINVWNWVGLENYKEIFTEDYLFPKSLWNAFYFCLVGVPLSSVVVPILVAMVFNFDIRGMRVMRTIYFLPSVCSATAVALLWTWIYQPDGWLNQLLMTLGMKDPPGWMMEPILVKPAVIFMGLWATAGFNSIIYLAGLKQIPSHLYEAAMIDGAGPLNRLRHVTLPMLSPTIFFMLVIGTIASFQIFEGIYVMTETQSPGGPDHAAYTIIYHIYKNAFDYERMGYAAALSFVLFGIIAILTLLQFWGQKRWVHYE